MSIECKPATASGHKADSVHARGGKGKSSPADAAGDAGPAGFMAILSAQEEPATDGPSLVGADASLATQQTPNDPPVPLSPNGVANAQPFVGATAAKSTGQDTGNAKAGAIVAAGLPSEGLDGAGKLAAAQTGDALNSVVTSPNFGQGTRLPPGGGGATPKEGADVGLGEPSLGGSGKDFRRMVAKAKADKAAHGNDGNAPGLSPALGGAAPEVRENRDARMLAAMDIHKLLQPVSKEEVIALPTLARDEKRASDRSVFASSAESNGNTPLAANNAPEFSDFGFSAVSEVSAPPEVQVAEQVQFWISQDVQNAEMQLEGLGEKPVEVSITMHGNEAHVAFRTDELLARGVLEGAEAHLRDMLGREGLVLSGVSVGTSRDQGSSGDGRQQRQGERKQATVAPAAVTEGRVARGNFGVAGRSLDLFV